MRDDLLQPAFAIYNSPGVYALLLGSGVSRSAEIMTGWDIMRDLIKQIATALGEKIEGLPEDWYRERFENEPGYDLLLEHLGQTPLDRNAILKDYIEPSEADREEERKLPMPAHKAIAWLVEKGYIRVILTTNFDRLIETALQQQGITPDVVRTDSDIETARPLQHSPVTVIKIHGDYRDEITKNTKTELAEYGEGMKRLLSRVFSEYGLIVCGWSAEWDTALREVLENSKPRFATYWSWYSEPKEPTKELIGKRKAYEISAIGADELFGELQKMVEALEGTKQEPPLNVAVAIERTKKLLASSERFIAVDDLLHEVTEIGIVSLSNALSGTPVSSVDDQLQICFEKSKLSLHVFAALCFYDTGNHTNRVEDAISFWMEKQYEGKVSGFLYRDFPILLLIYTCGIAALYRGHWKYLKATLLMPRRRTRHGSIRKSILSELLNNFAGYTESMPFHENRIMPFVYWLLKPIFTRFEPSEELFNDIFELFEIVIRLIYLGNNPEANDFWRVGETPYRTPRSYVNEFFSEGGNLGSDWDFLMAGFFDNNPVKLYDALTRYVKIAQMQNYQFPEQNVDYAETYSHGQDVTRWR